MPTYDFHCSSCDTNFEAFRSFAQGTEDVVCPTDGALATRVFSPPLDMIVYGGKSSRSPVVPPGGQPGAGAGGHGHSHGPGGHSHGPGGHSHGGHGHSHGPGTAPHSH
jgi:putative FmdB family regulatory protein